MQCWNLDRRNYWLPKNAQWRSGVPWTSDTLEHQNIHYEFEKYDDRHLTTVCLYWQLQCHWPSMESPPHINFHADITTVNSMPTLKIEYFGPIKVEVLLFRGAFFGWAFIFRYRWWYSIKPLQPLSLPLLSSILPNRFQGANLCPEENDDQSRPRNAPKKKPMNIPKVFIAEGKSSKVEQSVLHESNLRLEWRRATDFGFAATGSKSSISHTVEDRRAT